MSDYETIERMMEQPSQPLIYEGTNTYKGIWMRLFPLNTKNPYVGEAIGFEFIDGKLCRVYS